MSSSEVAFLLIICAFCTAMIRILPIFFKIPENSQIINRFFEALPYAVLTLLVFPGIFSSAGTAPSDIVKVSMGIAVITFLSLKKYGLDIVITVSMAVIFLFDIFK